jgi:hypothetical protein
MDGDRFDRISRSIAEKSTRRQALFRLGKGGIGASILGLAGVRAAAAQDGDTTTCQLNFSARFVTGPGEGSSLSGELTIAIGPEGAIDDGTFRSSQGATFDVVGQATGRSLDMLFINTEDDQRISLNGVAARDVELCRGGIRGTFGGPDVENLGTWRATRPATDTVTATPEGGPGGPGGPEPTTVPGAPTATPTPCPTVDCGVTFVQDPVTCECVCPAPYDRCDDVCCFGGATCLGGNSCACPAGTEPCNEVCTTSCPSGQVLDSTTCECVTAPIEPTATTPPCPSGQDLCGGVCVSITTNPNCGSCGNVCPTGIPCIAGHCQCPFGYSVCPGVGCKDLSADEQNCGSCGVVCDALTECKAGVCKPI